MGGNRRRRATERGLSHRLKAQRLGVGAVVAGLLVVTLSAVAVAGERRAARVTHGAVTVAMRGSREGGAIYYRGFQVATGVGEVVLRGWGLSHLKGRVLFRGPDLRRDVAHVESGSLVVRGGGRADDAMAYELHIAPLLGDRVSVRLRYRVGDRAATGVQVNLARLAPYWVEGGAVSVDGGAKRVRIARPATGWKLGNTVARGRRLALTTPLVDVSLEAGKGAPAVVLADRRPSEWRRPPDFLVFSKLDPWTRKGWQQVEWTLRFEPGSLASMAQVAKMGISQRVQRIAPDTFWDRVRGHGGGKNSLPVRGQVLVLERPVRRDVGLFKRYLLALSRAGANTIVLLHRPEQVRLLRADAHTALWWSRQEMVEVATYAWSLGIKVIPGMMSKFRRNMFPELLQPPGSNFYCADDPRSYRFLFGLYQTLIDLYHPCSFFIGHDEITHLAACGKEKVSKSELLALDVTKIHDWLQERGIKTLMWGDMLLDHDRWHGWGAANSGNPRWGSGETATAIEHIPRDVVILDWHYRPKEDYPTVRYFREHGFPVWGVAWHDADATVALGRSVRRCGGEGLLGSDWGFWSTLSPAATNLYAPAVGLDSGFEARDGGADGIAALAETLRDSLTAGRFVPVSLASAANETTLDARPWDGHGWFDLGPALDFRNLRAGRGRYGGVDFAVAPLDAKHDRNVAVVVGADLKGARRVEIPVERRVRALAFLHAAYVPSPRVWRRPLGRYTVAFESGPAATVELQEGQNIMDSRLVRGLRLNPWGFFRGVEELVGARVGYEGQTMSGVRVVSHVLVWRNPTPGRVVRAVRLEVAERAKGCRIGLLAVSVLPAESVQGRKGGWSAKVSP